MRSFLIADLHRLDKSARFECSEVRGDGPGNGHRVGIGDIILEHVRERTIPIRSLEWCRGELVSSVTVRGKGSRRGIEKRTCDHLVDQDTQCPPIHSRCVSASLDDFWGNVLFSTNERVRSEVRDARLGVHEHRLPDDQLLDPFIYCQCTNLDLPRWDHPV